MKLNISEIKTPHKRDRDHTDISKLAESMKEVGQLEPIVLNDRNEIISGRRRFFAAKSLKLSKIDVTYFDKKAIDQELATIDANLMILPLGEVDHDQALSKRKKLYEQKYPETRQYASGSTERKTFTKDVSDTLGITNRSVELAITRAEKASALVTKARREGRISPTIVNNIVRLPAAYQDELLPVLKGKKVAEVKKLVQVAMERDIGQAMKMASKSKFVLAPIENIDKEMGKLEELITKAIKGKSKYEISEIKPVITKAGKLIEHLEKFIELNTPIYKPILRKAMLNAS